MFLDNLSRLHGSKRPSKRVGRGCGSGKGMHTTGRGQKGQLARTGSKPPFGYEGGQEPLFRKLPRLGGFRNFTARRVVTVSLDSFNVFDAGQVVTPKDLVKAHIIRRVPRDGVKILNKGELTRKLTFSGFLMSEAARKKIDASGSKITNA